MDSPEQPKHQFKQYQRLFYTILHDSNCRIIVRKYYGIYSRWQRQFLPDDGCSVCWIPWGFWCFARHKLILASRFIIRKHRRLKYAFKYMLHIRTVGFLFIVLWQSKRNFYSGPNVSLAFWFKRYI